MISIIIPAYKAVKYIDECINSMHGAEILVGVDNCQETLDFLKGREGIRLFFFTKNVGPYIIKNTLIDLVSNEHVLFFDSDDILAKDVLDKIDDALSSTDYLKINYVNFYHDINKIESKMNDGIIAIKKSVFNKLNGFQPWRCAADTELHNRLIYNNFKSKTLSDIVCYRRLHGENLTMRKDLGHGSTIRNQYCNIISRNTQNKSWPNPNTKTTQEYVTY